MIVLDIEQGSDDWIEARLGIPTGSQADRILTPKTRKASTQATAYRNQLLSEWLTGFPANFATPNGWMERGVSMEPEAIAWYEMQHDVEVERVGFVLRDDGKFGGSPDGLVGDDGLVEIKCPALHTHLGYMLDEGPDHTGQIQSYLALTGRQWIDTVSYHPDLPPVVVRSERDPSYIEPFTRVLDGFIEHLEEMKARLAEYRNSRLLERAVERSPAELEPRCSSGAGRPADFDMPYARGG